MPRCNFLDLIGKQVKTNMPSIPDGVNYSVVNFGELTRLWIKTKGCRYIRREHGGCSFCDYGYSNQPNKKELFSYINSAFNEIETNAKTLLIVTSGSFLDNEEIPALVHQYFYEKLKKLKNTRIVIESHIGSINQRKLTLIRNCLPKHSIDIEFGLESSNPLILKYSINKQSINFSVVRKKILLMERYSINPVSNITVGNPFLSQEQIIQDATKTIEYSINNGINYIVLFPVNIKPYTIVNWLYKHGLYNTMSLWTYIEVLIKNRVFSNRIELAWYKYQKENKHNKLYVDDFQTPTTCDKCENLVVGLLNEYSENKSKRIMILKQLNNISCACKIVWRSSLNKKSEFKVEIKEAFQIMGLKILGTKYWDENKSNIYEEIDNDFRNSL